MKKIIYLIIINLIIFIPNVYASVIENDEINFKILSDGTGLVEEKWDINAQEDNYFEKNIYNAKDIIISDIDIINNSNNTSLTSYDKINKNKINTYSYKDNGISKKISIILDTKKNNSYLIKYKLNGFIKHFEDGLYGMDYTFIGLNTKQAIRNVNIKISCDSYNFMTTNTNSFVIGKYLNTFIKDGSILINSSKYDNFSSSIRLITFFNNIKFNNVIFINKNYEDYKDDIINEDMYINYIFNHIPYNFISILIFILILIILIILLLKYIKNKDNREEYSNIKYKSKLGLKSLDKVDYYQEIPLNGDLYKIEFISTYFGISKSKNDLISSLILKWIFDDIIKLVNNKDECYIKLTSKKLDSSIDLNNDIYYMLYEASIDGLIENNELERYSYSNYLKIIDWYNKCIKYSIEDDVKNNRLDKIEKINRTYYEINDNEVDIANDIQGLKKYLLAFNQVPRVTALTENKYKGLLVIAELLGIGRELSDEILRKNPDNKYAIILSKFEKSKYLFDNIIENAYKVKNKK